MGAARLVDGRAPWTVHGGTQFHTFMARMLEQLARRPVLALPRGFRFQPADPDDVADRPARQVGSGQAGAATDLGGPEILALGKPARRCVRPSGRRRPTVSVPVPGRLAAAFRAGGDLCPDGLRGQVSGAELLHRQGSR